MEGRRDFTILKRSFTSVATEERNWFTSSAMEWYGAEPASFVQKWCFELDKFYERKNEGKNVSISGYKYFMKKS